MGRIVLVGPLPHFHEVLVPDILTWFQNIVDKVKLLLYNSVPEDT